MAPGGQEESFDVARVATLDAFRADAARWIVPEQIGDPAAITPLVAARLLLRHPPLRAMAWFRAAQWARERGVRGVGGYVQRRLLRHYGLELAPSTPVGPGLYIAHPVGCVLHAARIGSNVTVIGQTTFGTRTDARWPVIGDGAFIGVGARVLGGITVGDRSIVGANAVVTRDVPADTTAVGVPARVIERVST
jgi:serine O-acetyltransferase